MGDSWTVISAVAAMIGAIAAVIAAWAGLLVYFRQRADDDDAPRLSCDISSVAGAPGWFGVVIILTNYSATKWKADRVELLQPAAAGIESEAAVSERTAYGGFEIKLPENSSARAAELDGEIYPAGATGFRGNSADTRRVMLFVYSPSTRDRKLSMRLSLRSMDAVHRHRVISIKRQLPPTASTAAGSP